MTDTNDKVLKVNGVDYPFNELSEKVKALSEVLVIWEKELEGQRDDYHKKVLAIQKTEAAIAHLSNVIVSTLEEEKNVSSDEPQVEGE